MGFMDKLIEAKKKATVQAFKSGEEADTLGRKAAKLEKKPDKTKEESEQVRQLRKEAEKMREQQEQARALGNRMSLGEKILRCYFTYKLASLACRTLVGLAGGYDRGGYAMANAVTNGIDNMSEKLADRIEEQAERSENPDQARAQMIEETLESFERMSQEAQEQGLTREGEPLLSDEDKQKIQELADISRDSENEHQAEQYAAKCQELGLDYNEAMTAFQQDKTFDEVSRDVTIDREAEIKQEVPSYEMEV